MKKSLFPNLRAFLLVSCFSLPVLCGILLALSLQSGDALPTAARETENGKEARSEEGITTLLFLGKDEASGNTDSVILASLDGEAGRITVMQIPRDVFVREDGNTGKLCSLYPRYLAETGSARLALDRVKAFLSHALGTPIDHALLLSGNEVKGAVDALGGVELEIPADLDYDDPAQGLSIHLKKGRQTLSGEDAVKFLRFRSSYATADLGRLDAQKIFLAAAKKAASEASLPRLIEAAGTVYAGCVTDLTLEKVPSLLVRASKTGGENTVFLTAPGAPISSEGGSYYVLCRAALTRLLADSFGAEGGFDPETVFSCPERTEIHEIYCRSASSYPVSERDAEEIGENGIPIPIP